MNATLARVTLGAPAALAITAVLFLVMQVLIRTELIPRIEAADPPDIQSAQLPEEIEPHRLTIVDIEPVDPPPVPPGIDNRIDAPSQAPAFEGAMPDLEHEVALEDGPAVRFARNAAPAVRVEPVYPARAAARGIEGRCTVIFDVLASGRTANIRVGQCDSGGFAQATTRAVERWRYSVREGRAPDEVVRAGLSTELVFRLAD